MRCSDAAMTRVRNHVGALAALAALLAACRSEEHTSELQSQSNVVCRLLLEKKKVRQARATRRDVPPLALLDVELVGEPRGDQLLHERLSLGTEPRKLVVLTAHDAGRPTYVT